MYYSELSYTTEDYYDSYNKYVEGNQLYYINRHVFRDIINDYFKYLASEIIDKGRDVRIPARLGYLCVVKNKPTKLNSKYLQVDFKETKKISKRVFHMNEHSDGYKYKFKWSKLSMILALKNLYELKMTRANKRYLATVIKSKKQDYIEN